MPASKSLQFSLLQLALLVVLCTSLLLTALAPGAFHRGAGILLMVLGSVGSSILLFYVQNRLACSDCAHDWRVPTATKASKTSAEMAR